jgi:dTMP kinase
MAARFIDLEGIDQAGKETQSGLLQREFHRRGLTSVNLDFPSYSSVIGKEIRAFLKGRRSYNPHALHMLYSLNRWENRKKIMRALDNADIVMTDRYTPSNIAYGLAKGLKLDWLTGLDRGLPEPDSVIVLDVPVEYSFARKRERRDIHEGNRKLLLRVRRNYLSLARKLNWLVIDASRPAKTVHEDILKKVLPR